MIRSFMTLYAVDIGIDDRPLDDDAAAVAGGEVSDARRPAARSSIGWGLGSRTIPGIEAFAVTTGVPPLDGGERLVEIDGSREHQSGRAFVWTVTITPGFFEVMGAVGRPRPRISASADGAPGSETVIINERLAAQFFPGEDPIGRQLRFTQRDPAPDEAPDRWRTIVGISPSIRHGSAQDAYRQRRRVPPVPAGCAVEQRRCSSAARCRQPRSWKPCAGKCGPSIADQPVFTIQTVEEMLAAGRWPYRIFGSLFVVLAVIALVLSCVGLYAVMAYSVTQRTQEIGVRMALGARRQQVSWLILRRGFVQLAIGLPLGLAGALALGVVLQGILVDLMPGDPITLAAVTVLLTTVSVAACLIPALRATRIDPVVALRAE